MTAGDAPRRVLILGGTGEARQLAGLLTGDRDLAVISSLAGRLDQPLTPPGAVRVGGFGGQVGLATWLRAERITAVVDATHPFAVAITASAVAACHTTGVPLLVLRRPGWQPRPGDDWHRVPSLAAAAELVPSLGRRVLLTVGRSGVAAFAGVPRCWFLARAVQPPEPPVPPRLEVITFRGPYSVDGELALLRDRRIDVLVSKDSGGEMTAGKLVAARELGLPVVLVDRPPPPAAAIVTTVDAALRWLRLEAGVAAG